MRTAYLMMPIGMGALMLACNGETPTSPEPMQFTRAEAGVTKQMVAGTIRFAGSGAPGSEVITPGGMCHFFDVPVRTRYTGDVEGLITYHEQQQVTCDRTHLVATGPFDGQVTWNGLSGTISGQFTTNCMPDATQPRGISCDGTTNARGSGGLEGVQFHFKWGPGFYPFQYTGTVFWK